MSGDPGTGQAGGLEDRALPSVPPLLPRGEAAAADEGDGGQGYPRPEGVSGTQDTQMVRTFASRIPWALLQWKPSTRTSLK